MSVEVESYGPGTTRQNGAGLEVTVLGGFWRAGVLYVAATGQVDVAPRTGPPPRPEGMRIASVEVLTPEGRWQPLEVRGGSGVTGRTSWQVLSEWACAVAPERILVSPQGLEQKVEIRRILDLNGEQADH